jgi:hypothetical protein
VLYVLQAVMRSMQLMSASSGRDTMKLNSMPCSLSERRGSFVITLHVPCGARCVTACKPCSLNGHNIRATKSSHCEI